METATNKVVGRDAATTLCAWLVKNSCWFVLTPYPDGVWIVEVKDKDEMLLTEIIRRIA